MREELRTLIGGIEAEGAPKALDRGDVAFPFFGRARDIETLRSVLDTVRKEGECRGVLLLGARGAGKTRAIDELLRGAEKLEDPPIRIFRSTATQGSAPFACFTQILSQRFTLQDDLDPEEAKATVRSQVAQVLDDRKVGDVLYFLGELLELEFPKSPLTKAFDSSAPETALFVRNVVRSFLEADAAFGPMCLVLDDAHFCHEQTLTLLSYLVENLAAPVLFLCAGRPELGARFEPWPSEPRGSVMELGQLADVDARALLGSLLSSSELVPMHLIDEARAITGGNPGLIEETAQFYREKGKFPENGANRAATPEARLDKLDAQERLLLQRAALIGPVFWRGALLSIFRAGNEVPALWNDESSADQGDLEARLASLAERDYVLRLPDSTFTGDEEYVFRERALRDRVAAHTSAQDARKWHQIVADWLDAQPAVRGDEDCLAMLAEHREKSGAPEEAVLALIEAAELARAQKNARQELSHRQRVLDLARPASSLVRLNAAFRAAELFEGLDKNDEALEHYRMTLGIAFRLDHRGAGRAAHLGLGRVCALLGRADEALAHLESARGLAPRTGS